MIEKSGIHLWLWNSRKRSYIGGILRKFSYCPVTPERQDSIYAVKPNQNENEDNYIIEYRADPKSVRLIRN